ncbi:carboxylesterase [Colletotrichum graminicola M1.001]|uniref:Carboxylic ester hydrolase n=1 Tax=Colletotrichum graminicola (strain M1.001 / M2 / FGSC 10212) TaxID=645133 RepID=E3QH27_COLGM|nr:carboxylesterase [Colletotrichum graminicola M1.001]EFQ30189.1 carboxylesterase [Colletotrichum graminicola M1.001]
MLVCKGNPFLDSLGLLALVTFASRVTATGTSQLPTVDLGYAIHQATYNDLRNWFNFSNIHYASAPRFGAPAPVTIVDRQINDGQTPGICPLKLPTWFGLETLYLSGQMSLEEVNSTYINLQNLSPSSDASLINQYLVEPDPRVTEDCLTLDVVVPEKAWKRARDASGAAPVLVWLYGGGYTVGDKNYAGNPAGLIEKAQMDGSDGVVYVAINYRLGLFGFASGPDYEEHGGVSNLGLRDQRFALEWIQKNIHLFGGDPENVTVLGESAGGGSILHQITAYGSTSRAPFKRAILQSPGLEPNVGTTKQSLRYNKALNWASYFSNSSVKTLKDLEQLPFDVVEKVNQMTVATTNWGSFGWGPETDGDFVPEPPGVLLSKGRFDSFVEVLTAHNSDEGSIFASPLIESNEQFISSLLKPLLPDAPDKVIEYIATELYPPMYDGTYLWTTPLERTSTVVAESWFICNNYMLNKALAGNAFNYLFDVAPGYHGNDIPYTFFNNETSSAGGPLNASIAYTLQAYLTNFALTGSPNGAGLPDIARYGAEKTVLSLYNRTQVVDMTASERCDWWQMTLHRYVDGYSAITYDEGEERLLAIVDAVR